MRSLRGFDPALLRNHVLRLAPLFVELVPTSHHSISQHHDLPSPSTAQHNVTPPTSNPFRTTLLDTPNLSPTPLRLRRRSTRKQQAPTPRPEARRRCG